MHNKILTGLLATATALAMGTLPGQAFTNFTYNSKLSTGKWVKIEVPSDGIYQITAEQLAEMGFDDPSHVQIYGQGGHPIQENLTGTHVDDLAMVPMAVYNDKVIFYAQGTVGLQMLDYYSTNPYYVRTRNAYANSGYYFVTQTSSQQTVAQQTAPTPGTLQLRNSYGVFLHESELAAVGFTGKKLLGESLIPNGLSIDYLLPNRSDSTITLHLESAAKVTNQVAYVDASIVSGGVTYDPEYKTSENKIRAVGSKDIQRHYYEVINTRSLKLNDTNDAGTLNVWIDNPWGATVMLGHLDYGTITYKHTNSYDGNPSNSFTMGFPSIAADVQVVMPGTDSQTVVWDVTDPRNVTQMHLGQTSDGDATAMGFTPGRKVTPSQYIAFNPSLKLNEIASFAPVENQNLHGLSTPDLLIVTNSYFMPEAERLAQMHRDHDNITVHVVDQEQVFNEFSSGTPDAMAIRLLCKMFYERNSMKFKNLLMFGPASYDNRGITTNKNNRVIVYESDASESDAISFGTDDFFGVLADNTGTNLPSQNLSIGVGRLTPADLTQARQNVDKIMHYVLNPDYGPWRNHYMLWADTGNSDLHALQAERIYNTIQDSLNVHMIADKAYVDMFPLEGNISSEARRHIVDMLNSGQYYGTYVGHAGTKQFTTSRMWTVTNVRNQSYEHQPIFMTACCDVARFDSNDQGIAELMLHQPNGGAIALLTSSREVEATSNDTLNRAFTQAVFGYNPATTLGEAYKKAKQHRYVQGDINKMSFLLLGDPAIKIQHPKSLFKIKTINGIDVTDSQNLASLAPLQQVTVEADVTQSDGTTINSSFNGDATLSIYDTERLLKDATCSLETVFIKGKIYYPRDLLAEVQGRVEGGHFTGTATLPRYFKAQPGEQLAVYVYAHKDDSNVMVNGSTTQVKTAAYDEQTAVQDDAAPVIEAYYINEQETFEQGIPVSPNSTLHATATDDIAFNNQSMGVGSTTKLVLDGSISYSLVHNYITVGDGGKTLQLHFPLTGLTPGQHSLTLSVCDVAGNSTSRTITFMVGGESKVSLKTNDLVAIDQTTVDVDETELTNLPPMTLKVVNAQGQLVWSTTASLPCTWDLTDAQGQRVAPGLYKMFGQYDNGATHGGTNIMPVIVMNPVKNAQP